MSVQREILFDATELKTLRMDLISHRGNRETSVVPCGDSLLRGRLAKAASRMGNTHAAEESNGLIVPSKRANNADEAPPLAAEESVEGRGAAKGNGERSQADRPLHREHQSWGLLGVRIAAEKDRQLRSTNLMHHLTLELLTSSNFDMKKSEASGIDGVTWREYTLAFETRLQAWHDRLHRGAYRAQPLKRQ